MTQTPRAVVLGLTAMLGAGVFAGFAPAAALAGWWFVPALLLSAAAAFCSAVSTAEQTRANPDLGGGYGHIRTQLGPWPARLSASAYLLGRFAMAAAIATTFGRYVAPDHPMTAAVVLLVATAVLLAAGFRPTTGMSWAAAVVVLGALTAVAVSCFAIAPPQQVVPVGEANELVGAGGLLFAAFLGFERLTAPVGEPAQSHRTPRFAVPITIVAALGVYLVVGIGVTRQLGVDRLGLSTTPLRDAMVAADAGALMPVVQAGAAVAAFAAMYFLLAGTRRTMTAMVEYGDLPTALSRAPRAVEVLAAAAAVVAVLLMPFDLALGVAACGMLFHYAFTNAAARILLQDENTSWPMRNACLGLGLSVLLAMSVPVPALLTTFVGLAVGTGVLGLISRTGTASPSRQPTLRAT